MLISNVEGAPCEGSVLNKKLFLPARWSYMVRVSIHWIYIKKILIVDDDNDILEITSRILKFEGFQVKTYSTGLQVPEIVQQYQPDLILLDIRLSGKSGTEVCKEVKSYNRYLPVLFFSAHAKEGDILDECGADGFIKKPYDMKLLVSTINLHVNCLWHFN